MSQLYLKGVYYDPESGELWFLNNSGTYEQISIGVSNSLQEVTDTGNTTNKDIEITDLTKGVVLTADGGRRVRITATDDGSGNLQLTMTEL